ncbi:hypothetical protein CAEBREN_26178 [Caenorhabditis brenneri]|uniref:Uncharacterized protein n=1 Tax=Caenorhabditis brenneri TaxID=135651 RepID=G0N0R8_CAEBE|nr:hypothetical protein CAEBREN_26178 [Caenorhabditis brenneri]
MSEIFQSNEVDEQVIVETFATLGHKVSKTAWQLQEHLDEAEETLFQTNLNFVPQHFPKQEDPVHITGMANRSTFGSHYLSLEIVSFDDSTGEGILVGAGHSIVQPAVDAVWPESPSTTPVAIVHQNTDPTTTASLSNPPMSSSTAAAATLPGPSILSRPRVGAATLGKRNRHVSFGGDDDDVQVRPINTTHEVFPIKKRDRHVFFFDVVGDKMISRVENLMQPRNWAYYFGIRTLLLEDQHPFTAKAIPMSSIIETLLLSQMLGKNFNRPPPSSYVLKDDLHQQLADKKYSGKVLNDDAMTAEIVHCLNKDGKRIFIRG